MGKGINKAVIVGTLGNDPEIKYAENGNAVVNVSVATNESWKDRTTGEAQERTEWHRIVMFGKLGEIAQQYLKKGSQAYFEGRIRTNKWQDSDGSTQARDESSDLGGTMRLGAQQCHLHEGTRVREIYGQDSVMERHRHRYEINNNYLEQLQEAGVVVGGWSADRSLVEMIELRDHPWFVACQFHPEFTSRPRGGHPLFTSYIKAALDHAGA